MRNPDRIDQFGDELKTIWHQVPDWRFSQLMINAMGNYVQEHGCDPFYVEDEKFLAYLSDYVRRFSDES